ncbi:MAG: hypothetical protein R3F31_19120 [Verrucomicrobiales bacterium]
MHGNFGASAQPEERTGGAMELEWVPSAAAGEVVCVLVVPVSYMTGPLPLVRNWVMGDWASPNFQAIGCYDQFGSFLQGNMSADFIVMKGRRKIFWEKSSKSNHEEMIIHGDTNVASSLESGLKKIVFSSC